MVMQDLSIGPDDKNLVRLKITTQLPTTLPYLKNVHFSSLARFKIYLLECQGVLPPYKNKFETTFVYSRVLCTVSPVEYT